jgi:hypothetical protein
LSRPGPSGRRRHGRRLQGRRHAAQAARRENIYPVDIAQRPLVEHLGTPSEHKQHRLFEGSHDMILQRKSELVKEMLDWFDRYLGPVNR